MFLLEDLHLAGVIGLAVVVAGLGIRLLRRRPRLAFAVACIEPKPMKPGIIVGGLLFGAGWALTGTCPGTGLSQLGEGKPMTLFTVAGIVLGSWLHAKVGPRLEPWLAAHSMRGAIGPSDAHQ